MVNCEISRVSFAIWSWDPGLIIGSGDLLGIHKDISFFLFIVMHGSSLFLRYLFCNLRGFVLTLIVISLVLQNLIQQKERFFVPAFMRQTDHFIIVVDHL